MYSLFPTTRDEPTVKLKFYGRCETSYVEVDGWTREIPLNFVGLKEGLKIKIIAADTGSTDVDVPQGFTKSHNSAVCLKLMESKTGSYVSQMPCPVRVRVLAKKKLDVFMKDKSLLMFGYLLVGDETGFCKLEVVNDSIRTLYQQVTVGDFLLIAAARVGECPLLRDEENSLGFDSNQYVKLKIKVSNYNCRHVYKVQRQLATILPPCYFIERKILSVTDLTPNLRNCNALEGKGKFFYFDLIGVICHAGRVERYRINCPEVILHDGEEEKKAFFMAYRWLELIDSKSLSSLPVHLYFNQNNWNSQDSLVPGSLIVVTNVLRHCEDMYHSRICSSRLSQVYVNNQALEYVQYLSDSLKKVTSQFFGFSNAKSVLKKKGVVWSAGGSYPTPVESSERFREYFDKRTHRDRDGARRVKDLLSFDTNDPECSLKRREAKRMVFQGVMRKYRSVPINVQDMSVSNANRDKLLETCEVYEKVCSSFLANPEQNWYMFPRCLPVIDLNHLGQAGGTPTWLYESLSSEYKKYCDPLCMPAKGDVQSLKDLPIQDFSDKCPGFVVQIVNKNLDPFEEYYCIWKPSRYMSSDQMQAKLRQANNSKLSLLFMVDVHYIEEEQDGKQVKEIILQDFTYAQESIEKCPSRHSIPDPVS